MSAVMYSIQLALLFTSLIGGYLVHGPNGSEAISSEALMSLIASGTGKKWNLNICYWDSNKNSIKLSKIFRERIFCKILVVIISIQTFITPQLNEE